MTCKTLFVVIRWFLLQLVVRIVTSQTAYPGVVGVVATAIEHSIRLKTNIVNSRLARQEHRLLETSMTGATERLRKFVCAEFPGIEDLRLVNLLFLHRGKMLLTWSMTSFTSYAGTPSLELQLHSINCARRVTTKTLLWLVAANRTPESVVERRGH